MEEEAFALSSEWGLEQGEAFSGKRRENTKTRGEQPGGQSHRANGVPSSPG